MHGKYECKSKERGNVKGHVILFWRGFDIQTARRMKERVGESENCKREGKWVWLTNGKAQINDTFSHCK